MQHLWHKPEHSDVFPAQSPHAFSPDLLTATEVTFNSWARQATGIFSLALHTASTVTLHTIQPQSYSMWNRDASLSSMFVILHGPIRSIIRVDRTLAVTMVDYLLGGDGDSTIPDREMTDLEQSVWQAFSHQWLQILSSFWTHTTYTWNIQNIEFDAAFINLLADSDWVVTVPFSVTIGNITGDWEWVWPLTDFIPLIKQLLPNSLSTPSLEWAQALQSVPIPVHAMLGETQLRWEEYQQLAENFIIRLDQLTQDPITVTVGNKPKALGQLGVLREHYAVTMDTDFSQKKGDFLHD